MSKPSRTWNTTTLCAAILVMYTWTEDDVVEAHATARDFLWGIWAIHVARKWMLIVERFDREGLYQLQNCGETNRRITEVKVCREFAVEKLVETAAVCKLNLSKVLCIYVPLSSYYKCTNLHVVKTFVYSTEQPRMNMIIAQNHRVTSSRTSWKRPTTHAEVAMFC